MANIKDKIENIRKAVFGKEVRGSLADGLDAVNKETETTTSKQTHLEKTFDELIINSGASNAEIVDARVDKNNNNSYAKLGDRLDAHSAQMDNIVQDTTIKFVGFDLEKASKIELDIERKRIDNFNQLNQGSTTGDAELIDSRLGQDGYRYSTSGASIRGQFKNANEIILPKLYMNFVKSAMEQSNALRPITATFDSIVIRDNRPVPEGNGGLSVVIPQGVSSIKFDAEHRGFGLNINIYICQGSALKQYVTSTNASVSTGVQINKGIELKLDWVTINKAMTDNPLLDNVKILFWNASNNLPNSYLKLTNIRVNDFKNLQQVNDTIFELDKTVLKKGQANISDITNKIDTVANTSQMVKWAGSNMVYNPTGDSITFSFGDATGNNGFQTPK
ncbi:MAG: hypothetical protein ACRC68_00995, partial [Clostridium sp.]